MISIEALTAVIATYQKHEWLLRRILLSDASNEAVNTLFDVPVANSTIDAAWFSRSPGNEAVAWELRYLGENPFALLEFLDENADDFEASLGEVERRLAESVGRIQLA